MPPQRRKSFAPTSTTGKSRRGLGRRAQSLVPGDTRHLAPRKSILKSTQFTFNAPSNQNNDALQPREQEQEYQHEDTASAEIEDDDAAENTTTDYRAEVSENTSRKSIGRRVSFAPFAQYRLFETNDQNTNSSGGPSSSPTPASPSNPEQSPQPPPPIPRLSNENDYPGRRVSIASARRVSMASGYGETSMSLDMDNYDEDSEPPTDPVFFPFTDDDGGNGDITAEEGIDEDTDEDEDDGDDDMEITEAIALNIHRKRSLSIAQQHAMARRSSLASRHRSSVKFAQPPPPSSDVDTENENREEEEEGDATTTSQATQESEAPMEFTIPLEKPLKEPKPPSEAWLALQAMTHSQREGVNDDEEEMELTNALSRLRNARASFDFGGQGEGNEGYEEPSFTSTDDSMDASVDIGDRTLNVTSLLGSVRNLEISGDDSERDTRSTQDEDYAQLNIPAVPTAPLKFQRKEDTLAQLAPAKVFSSVFSAPAQSATEIEPSAHASEQLNSRRSPSPVSMKKPKASDASSHLKPFISSVFAAPSPSPSRLPVPSSPSKLKAASTTTSPVKKRPPPSLDEASGVSQPSPAKKRALAGNSVTPLSQSRALNRQIPNTKGQVQDENMLSLSSFPSSFPAFKSKAAANSLEPEPMVTTVPAIVVTSEEIREDNGSESVMMDTEEQDQTMQWRANIASETLPTEIEHGFDDELPSISIEEFFMMTGVKFMDELTIPRRSTVHPSHLQGDRRDSTVLPSMAEFVTSMTVHIPQLQLYSWVAKDLQTWINNSKKIYHEAEDEVAKLTPSLFREFSQANEEGRAVLLHQLKLIKANKHSAAKEKWYEWKYQWIENLHENADKGFAELEKDRHTLSDIINQAQDLLPALRQQQAQIFLELEKERKEVEEVEQSDPRYLEELKVTIDEQNQLLEVYRADVTEGSAKLERLDEKLSELEAQKRESIQAIEEAERRITLNKTSTRAEVFRLKDELESLQVLHSWRIAKVKQQTLELVFEEQLLVTVPCIKYRPVSAEISISRIDASEEPKCAMKRPDPFPLFNDLVVRQGEAFIRGISVTSVKMIVEALSDFWTSCAQIRTQLTFLAIKYPLSLEPITSQMGDEYTGFKAAVSILLHKHKAKALVAFLFEDEVLARWPFAINKLQCEVKIAYGDIDSKEIRNAIMERLSEASVEDNHACLLDACVEAASRYE